MLAAFSLDGFLVPIVYLFSNGQSCELRIMHLFRLYHTHMLIHTMVVQWQLMAHLLL